MAPHSKKRKVRKLSMSERTPKKLKSVEPDLTVVVGGEEFYHYKVTLCSGCDFIDTMLSNQMRENDESRIEFPDKDPTEWLQVYSFLDPNEEKPAITADNALKLVMWFDYLGMEELARECDTVYSQNVVAQSDLNYFVQAWNHCKSYPCPLSHKKVLQNLVSFLTQFREQPTYPYGSYGYSSNSNNQKTGMNAAEAAKLKKLVLDDVGGDRVWETIKSSSCLHFPPQVSSLGRVELAENPLFEYLLRTSHNKTYLNEWCVYALALSKVEAMTVRY
jgi:hypothetical protein